VPTAEEKATFLEARDEMKQWFVERHGQEWLDKWQAAIDEAEAEIAAERAKIIGRKS